MIRFAWIFIFSLHEMLDTILSTHRSIVTSLSDPQVRNYFTSVSFYLNKWAISDTKLTNPHQNKESDIPSRIASSLT